MWKHRAFEPPASDRENSMAYVVAFEADGTAKDVTRRYAKAYTAKTLRLRVETAFERGDKWWRKALKPFSQRLPTDLDQIEDNELVANQAREPMPRNVADFKDHPIYSLERHLRRHEVLIPDAHEVGTIGAGNKGPLERIYRRRDVRIARTRDKWYRLGREVKPNEIPAKWLPKKAKTRDGDDDDDEGLAGTPIYTIDQTVLFEAPPIVNGYIPKNKFGNIDLYVPSMIPRGGAHVADDMAAKASFLLGIDYAPALSGFEFRGKRGTAKLNGVVVAEEHEDAVRATVASLRDLEAEMEEEIRTRRILAFWRKFLMVLRIRQRVGADVADEVGEEIDEAGDMMDDYNDGFNDGDDDGGGGFMVD
jgi:xeroderma pigmentosum group C-complementing protein